MIEENSEKKKRRNTAIVVARIAAVATILVALIGVIFPSYNSYVASHSTSLPTINIANLPNIINNVQNSTQTAGGTRNNISANISEQTPTNTPTFTPIPTPVIAKSKKLSKDLILDSFYTWMYFFEPPKDIVIANKIFHSDFQLYGGKITFKLDALQQKLHLECGLYEDNPKVTYQLKVIGDGNELSTQEYKGGENIVVSDIDIHGVIALTFITSSYGTSSVFCKDELIY